jgi:signal transduction histidine kinase
MGLLLLLPLYVPRDAPHGLERLPPHEQVRNGWALVALTVGALPALYLLVGAVRDDQPWAPGLFVVVVSGLLFLSVARQALAIGETRHLYGQVTRAAEERRRLLAEVMRSMDNDRHRVAAHLHEQAVSSYAAFVSLNLEAERIGARHGGTLLAEASARLRATFGDQAESLRRLTLAMQPLEADGRRSLAERLRSPIEAYAAGLWGDAAAPELRVEVRDGLALDWTTEAIVLRVAQEAIGNVRRHAGARRVDVRLDVDGDDHLTLTVADDGRGFDPAAVLREGGIAAMRSSAALIDADLTVESRPGAGATVRLAVRGAPPGPPPLPPPSRPDLRVIR